MSFRVERNSLRVQSAANAVSQRFCFPAASGGFAARVVRLAVSGQKSDKLYFRKNKSVLVVIFIFQNTNACLTPLASLQAARCFRRRCACSASSLARSPERTSPEQGLENAQNGKGQLWAKVGMRLGSAPRSLGVGAVLQGAGNEATFAACGPHGSVGVVVAGNTQTAGIVILRSPIRHTLRKRSGYAGMPKRQTISF